MKSFKYTAPSSEKEACRLLGESALALAGGSNLLNLMKNRVLEPDVVVDIKQTSPAEIEKTDSGLKIGANVTLAEILADQHLKESYPVLHQAVANVATPQLRNRATIGGNLCARPACWYFTSERFDCFKKGSSECPARDGENEFHAIFGTTGPCVMVHPSSAAPALLALNAGVEIAGPDGSRSAKLAEFFKVGDAKGETILEANEFLTAIELPGPAARSATYQVRQKSSHDWPISQASVVLDLAGETCRSARVYLGAVAPTPHRARGAESALIGKRVSASAAEAAGAASVEGARALSQNAYKITATRTAVERAILLAATGRWM